MILSLPKIGRTKGMQTVLRVGLITAISGLSDGFLYAYLPVKGEELGFTPIMVGVLLSMNRFVRFFTNRFVAFFANKIGVKKIYIIGILLSFVVSITYAFSPIFAFWVVARAIWGLSFSILRFSKLQYVSVCEKKGTALGWSASIGGTIQIIGYFIGPVLIALTFDGMPFLFFAFVLVFFIPLLFRLPDVQFVQQDIKLFRFQLPNRIDIWGFITNFSLDGMLIVGLSRLLKLEGDADTLLFYTAFFISIRRAIGIIFSPLVGTLVDRFGLQRAFNVEAWFLLVGMALIMVDLAPAGLIIIFIGATANQNITPLLRIHTTAKKEQFSGLTRLTSSQDMGSALGALLGLSLIIHLDHFYLFLALGLILLCFHFLVSRFIKKAAIMRKPI